MHHHVLSLEADEQKGTYIYVYPNQYITHSLPSSFADYYVIPTPSSSDSLSESQVLKLFKEQISHALKVHDAERDTSTKEKEDICTKALISLDETTKEHKAIPKEENLMAQLSAQLIKEFPDERLKEIAAEVIGKAGGAIGSSSMAPEQAEKVSTLDVAFGLCVARFRLPHRRPLSLLLSPFSSCLFLPSRSFQSRKNKPKCWIRRRMSWKALSRLYLIY